MLYTILSQAEIFPPAPAVRPSFYPRGCGGVECTSGPEGPVIQSLISTNPFDFLNPALAPGRVYRAALRR